MTPAHVTPAVEIDDRCTACGACLWTCPAHALLPAPGRPEVLTHRCTGCLECLEICPRAAITLAVRAPAGMPA